MDAELKPTVASKIVLPVRPKSLLIELEDIVDADGARVCVRVDKCDEVLVLRHVGLPGARSAAGKGDDGDQAMSQVEFLLRNCAPVIHASTSFVDAEGRALRPAFHCDLEHAVAGSVPWELMTLRDKLAVIQGSLELSGFGGAAEATFSSRGSAGGSPGVGALEGSEGHGQGAEGGPPGS